MISSGMSRPAKWLIRILLVAMASFVLCLCKIRIEESVVSAIYTVSGIMFSIALSQLMSFSFGDIENEAFVRRQRGLVNYLRTSFIVLFAFSTIAYLISELDMFHPYGNPACFSVLVSSLIYDVVNFCEIAKVKDEMDDRIRASKRKKKSETMPDES